MQNTFVLCNPHSGRVKKQLGRIRAFTATFPQLIYVEASTSAEFELFFKQHLLHEDSLLVVIAGDGTFHAVLTWLFADPPGHAGPVIYLIAGGTTNMTAADFGVTRPPYQQLQHLMRRLAAMDALDAPCIRRASLRVQNGQQTLCGMFLGTGMIAEGVNYFQKNLRAMGITGNLLPGLVLLRFLALCLLRSSRILPADPHLIIKTDGHVRFQGRAALTLVSVLNRLLLGCRPYWGEGEGVLRLTNVTEEITAKPAALLRSCAALLCGRGGRRPPDGCLSFSAADIILKFSGDFIIDGELYAAASDLVISTVEFRLLICD